MLILFALLTSLLNLSLAQEDYESYNVLLIRDSNIQQLISKYGELYLFMHNPNCPYSQQFRARFASFAVNLKQSESPEALGLVNCLKETEICHKYSVISFPTVVKANATGFEQINEMKLINRIQKVEDEPYITNQIIEWLEQSPNYAIVILEQEGMPVVERLERDRLIYLQPSLLYHTLFNLSGQRAGCWILQYDKNNTSALKKFSCGSGIDPLITLTGIEKFQAGKLQEYIYKSDYILGDQNQYQQNLNYDSLKAFMDLKIKPTKLIYFDAQWCVYCQGVTKGISESIDILREKKVGNQVKKYFKYIIDFNEIPKEKAILKVPYLEFWFNNNKHIFEGRFDGLSISQFIQAVIKKQKDSIKEKNSNQKNKQSSDL